MEYDAITIDSNIFDENALNLEGGMLQQLNQFGEGSAEFILSEIVVREVHRHLTIQAQKAKDASLAAIKKTGQTALLDVKSIAELNAIYANALDPSKAALERLIRFMAYSGCERIDVAKADMARLLSMYFESTAPFEGSGNKKNEFPDAIALITLEDWAKKNKKKILAISKDVGWQNFAETSDWIDVEKELPAALQKFQQHVDKAQIVVAALLDDLDGGSQKERGKKLEAYIESQLANLIPYAEAGAAYDFDSDFVSLSLVAIKFLRDGEDFNFHIVRIGREKIVARVGVNIVANASATFRFFIRDEGGSIPIGSSHETVQVGFNAGILITLVGNFAEGPSGYDLEDVELVDAIDNVDFGDVDPDFSDDP
jgi:hypothetical protein